MSCRVSGEYSGEAAGPGEPHVYICIYIYIHMICLNTKRKPLALGREGMISGSEEIGKIGSGREYKKRSQTARGPKEPYIVNLARV